MSKRSSVELLANMEPPTPVADAEGLDLSPEVETYVEEEREPSENGDLVSEAFQEGDDKPRALASISAPTDPAGRKPDQRVSRDFTKPQFIDFSSPLLADLFGRLPVSVKDYTVEIEEQYPSPDLLPVIAGDRYASEFIVQFDWQPCDANAES